MRKILRGYMGHSCGWWPWAGPRQRRAMRLRERFGRGGETRRCRRRVRRRWWDSDAGLDALPESRTAVASSEVVCDDAGRTARRIALYLSCRFDGQLREGPWGERRRGLAEQGGCGSRATEVAGFLTTKRIGGRAQQLVDVGRGRSRTLVNPPAVEAWGRPVSRGNRSPAQGNRQCAGNCVTAVDRAIAADVGSCRVQGISASTHIPAVSGNLPRIRVRPCRWESRFR
ncbi:hypothetical protein ATK86_0745 [Nocardia fluminea]|uniref:Uncharacterized protein n=1 Tax=Nocardia fluminea TaxID=134984 RepID=A0A2N3WXX8_9NOCA|nr:hypothetical protein ATK86_0745 [Nocardia fluminea]